MKLITIDGPSASGKSSVSRLVAKKLGWQWVSTGAFYRGLALATLRQNIAVTDIEKLNSWAASRAWQIKMTPENTEVFYHGEDVTSAIEGEGVGAVASQISQIPSVRKALLDRQRHCFVADKGLVAEGRDCGTVVFPQAPIKIFLTASPALRAMRRSEEENVSQEKTQEMQALRDKQDSRRKVAPLKVADGALSIDSSFLNLEEVALEVIKYAKSQGLEA